MSQSIKVSPSILAADFARLGAEVAAVDRAGADYIHLDIMDGHFVPNITVGPGVVKALRRHSEKPFDVHLMIAPVDGFLEAFAEAGASILTIHPEAGPHLHRSLQTIKGLGCRAGVALNPATPVAMLDPVMDLVDLVLVMTVNPGFGGQAFLESQLPKIEAVRRRVEEAGRPIDVQVDGGIGPDTARAAVNAGADVLVAGTAVFKGGPDAYADNIGWLKAV